MILRPKIKKLRMLGLSGGELSTLLSVLLTKQKFCAQAPKQCGAKNTQIFAGPLNFLLIKLRWVNINYNNILNTLQQVRIFGLSNVKGTY